MIANASDNWLGLVLAVLGCRLPVVRARLPGAILMSWQAIVFGLLLVVLVARDRAAARPVHGRRLRRQGGRHGAR